MNNEKDMTGDIIMGFLLIISGIAIVVVALGMKVFRNFLDAPGFFPLMLGCVFVLLGAALSFPALKKVGLSTLKDTFSKSNLSKFFKDDKTLRVTILLALMFVYVYFLIGWLNFTVATFLYLFFTMLYIKSTKWWMVIIISIVASVTISVVFKYGFRIPLPS
ncbi:tripartite tricarboxylate transporter TctB family protein [Oceanispirochaeta crateris]|uniref:Tripartite tricarboxylate transporter TctB family protein n=1 Tax=Oceanispirochaeta crateris TaxID=2518645 RepID=A0A5C1QQD2_9SPIO|nr:tripartite tricarboxylate transporter TctB family protein [Oceanispirochaeta crateris]QEN09180.1 tripartite tricarboxylate transporter TctB family protein [Oceanispirochaeta crateris]